MGAHEGAYHLKTAVSGPDRGDATVRTAASATAAAAQPMAALAAPAPSAKPLYAKQRNAGRQRVQRRPEQPATRP
jgi:hypothetical protein